MEWRKWSASWSVQCIGRTAGEGRTEVDGMTKTGEKPGRRIED